VVEVIAAVLGALRRQSKRLADFFVAVLGNEEDKAMNVSREENQELLGICANLRVAGIHSVLLPPHTKGYRS
jgi:hypothetical protein